jgi:ABC-2 type transport system ATP-binding protein
LEVEPVIVSGLAPCRNLSIRVRVGWDAHPDNARNSAEPANPGNGCAFMPTMIEAHNLVKKYAGQAAVAGVSLSIPAGEIYGLVGSDGAGKTTTIRMLAGALKADQGVCSIAGFDLATKTEDARAQIGYLSQRFSLYEDLTVLENIRFFAEVRGMRPDAWLPRCLEILEFVGLATFKDRRAGQLSGGMRQKLGLASALVARPRVLLLDEPTTGVDPVTRQDFWQLIIALVSGMGASGHAASVGDSAGAVSVLLSTPYMDEAARCHRVGFMDHGHIVAEGTPPSSGRGCPAGYGNYAADRFRSSSRSRKRIVPWKRCTRSGTACIYAREWNRWGI